MKGIKTSNIANFVCLKTSTYKYFKSQNCFIYGVDNFADDCFRDFMYQYPSNQPFFVQYQNRAYMAIEFVEPAFKDNSILKRGFVSHEIIEFWIGKCYLKSTYLLANLSTILSDAQLYTKIKIGKPVSKNKTKEKIDKKTDKNNSHKKREAFEICRKNKDYKHKDKQSNIRYITNNHNDRDECIEEKTYDLNKNYIPNKIFTGIKALHLFHYEDIVGKLEIIETVNSLNKHKNHKYDKNGTIKKFIYKKDDYFNIIELHVFYCEKCKVYFDYLESYKNQIDKANIKISDLIVAHHDSIGKPFHFDSHAEWSQESKLKKYGYAVGVSGKSSGEREKLLEFLIKHKIMTVDEIKKYLNQFISYNGKNKLMVNAKNDWIDDLNFLNSYFKK